MAGSNFGRTYSFRCFLMPLGVSSIHAADGFMLQMASSENQFGEQGWRSGGSARLPPMWPGVDSRTRRHVWVEFVVCSLLCSERFFSGYSGFLLSLKTNISKFQFDPGMYGHFWTSSCELLGAPWVSKLPLHLPSVFLKKRLPRSFRMHRDVQWPLLHSPLHVTMHGLSNHYRTLESEIKQFPIYTSRREKLKRKKELINHKIAQKYSSYYHQFTKGRKKKHI